MNCQLPDKIQIKSAQKDYAVEFFESLTSLKTSLESIESPIVFIDSKVKELYSAELAQITDKAPTLIIEATEENKSFERIGSVLTWMSNQKCSKSNHIVAIGGGIVQDIAAFASGVFFRGLPWTLVPTTLLSMADSCIGAKSGLNFNQSKNQIGLFNSPDRVLISPAFLTTLSEVEVKSGYGEILKLHITGGFSMFSALKSSISSNQGSLFCTDTSLHIANSLLIKKRIIEEDEYEKNLRMILNYGHTFGHALESATNHAIPHGIAVAWGLDFENYLSFKKGLLSRDRYLEIKQFINDHFSFDFRELLNTDTILEFARKDKKMVGPSEIRLIFFTGKDVLEIRKIGINSELKEHLSNYIESEQSLFTAS